MGITETYFANYASTNNFSYKKILNPDKKNLKLLRKKVGNYG